MLAQLRLIMAVAACSLLVAAALHAGLVISGPFNDAAMYETTIAVILLVGLGLTSIAPTGTRWISLVALAISLVGASIGLYLALRGIGPNTVPDIVYHFALVALLVIGLVVAWRVEDDPMRRAGSTQ